MSPKAAMTIANSVKYHGHVVLQMMLSLLSNTSLIHGKRIISIVLSSLQSSSSNAVRIVVDPVSVAEKNSSKKWLHASISLRSLSVQSFLNAIQRFGSNSIVSHTDSIVKGIVLISGFLLEQLTGNRDDTEKALEDDHWGTTDERAKLV